MKPAMLVLLAFLAAPAARADEATTFAVDFAAPGANRVTAAGTNGVFAFDGAGSSVPLPADLPMKIGARDFSLAFEFRADPSQEATAYILEHNHGAPWTGLYVAIENNKSMRFRLKDVPQCSVTFDVGAFVGDGAFHQVVLNRRGRTLEAWLDGESAGSEERDEVVDLAIDYGANVPVVGSHCSRGSAFFKGALCAMQFTIGRCLDAAEIRARHAASPRGIERARQQADRRQRLQGLIDRLRNGDVAERTRAVAELRKLDAASRAALGDLKDDPDPEVRETIREILAVDAPRPARPPPVRRIGPDVLVEF